jgi:membrane-anchored mycosin MYCP
VINMSLADCNAYATVMGSPNYPTLVNAVNNAYANGVVLVAAAGNLDSSGSCSKQNTNGTDPVTGVTPAQLDHVLAVGAVQEDGTPASFSIAGPWVNVAAPGTDLVATNPYRGANNQVSQLTTSEGTGPTQGTSFAAPYVAGVAALIISEHPTWTAGQVINQIEQTAAHPASPGGRNDYVGYGVVDPVAAVSEVLPDSPTASSSPIAIPAPRLSSFRGGRAHSA